jgi:rare lipoprotein A (peptidoglycan hydrolase)
MQKSSRVRAVWLYAVALTLFAVPIAHAAASDDQPTDTTGAITAPVAQEASFHPQIGARLSDASSTGRDGIHVRGLVLHAGSGNTKVVLAARRQGHSRWFKAATATVKPGKKFTIAWHSKKPGRYLTKITAYKYGKQVSDHLGAAFVYRTSFASYYGPGLYGSGLACGGRLSQSTVGVAHKTLPCGTKVTFKVGSHVVTARVIDRCPYVSGRDWDLTTALKNKLHFGSTGAVHATS